MALTDIPPSFNEDGTPVVNPTSDIKLLYECPLCLKSVESRDSINRHMLYHAINENYEYDLSCSSCTKQLALSLNLAECLLHTAEFRSHRISVNYYKYILTSAKTSSNDDDSLAELRQLPMVSCVMCQHQSSSLLKCVSHIMIDHFGYDSSVITLKRFVHYMFNDKSSQKEDEMIFDDTFNNKGDNSELESYFTTKFPQLISELITCTINAAVKELEIKQQSITTSTSIIPNREVNTCGGAGSKPEVFYRDVKCFKCGKYSTKIKKNLFAHLSQVHDFDIKEIEKQYELHLQRQIELIDKENLVNQFESKQKEISDQQIAAIKEKKEKNEELHKEYQQQQQQQQQNLDEQLKSQVQEQSDNQQQQQHILQLTQIPSNSNNNINNSTNNIATPINSDAIQLNSIPLQLQHQQQQPTLAIPITSTSQIQEQPITITTPSTTKQQHQNHYHRSSINSNGATVATLLNSMQQQQHHHHNQHQQQQHHQIQHQNQYHHQNQHQQPTKAQIDKIDSTIDQVLSQICKDDYEPPRNIAQQQQMVTAVQPAEAENLFVFKCNLCEPFSTDDATQLLEHYKLLHQIELTIADSSTLLAAAVAAFQTGHTIEMTGAILNTLSSVTDENGLTIINGEEVPVHTTVQYKCTICQMIFYEKQYIVQHLYEMHNFEVDISYFEDIEIQQQEQLQQKICEQQQEQLMLQQQQQQQQDPTQQNTLDVSTMDTSSQNRQQNAPITDETAAMMMMMMNGNSNTATTTETHPIDNKQQQINYTCTYCNLGVDKLKKMSDHLKQSHAFREKICMDNVRQQVIRLPNEDLPSYQQSPSSLNTSQQLSNKIQDPSAIMENLSSSIKNLTSSLAAAASVSIDNNNQVKTANSSLTQALNSVSSSPYTSSPSSNGRGGIKKTRQPRTPGSGRKSNQNNKIQQSIQGQNSIKAPTILTMDANSQIIIDFNQNDDLLCAYCDYTMNNLNYMRTHIKFKHKSNPITFQNKVTYKFYTIVEWPLTAVPTLTSANQQNQQIPSTTINNTPQPAVHKPTTPSNKPATVASVLAAAAASTAGAMATGSTMTPQLAIPINTTTTTTPNKNELQSDKNKSNDKEDTPSSTATSNETKKKSETSIQQLITAPLRNKLNNKNENHSEGSLTNTSTEKGINTNSVNTILKKLGVNVNSNASPLSSLINSIGTGATLNKSVNNSVVNVNLNMLKDVNIDDMIDDDDDEERSFLIKELEKKANNRGGSGHTTLTKQHNNNETDTTADGNNKSGVKRSRSNSSTTSGGLTQRNSNITESKIDNKSIKTSLKSSSSDSSDLMAQLNITLNCHYCWAQFQLNVSKNQKQPLQQKENGKYMQHLALHLNAPYKCNECSYPLTDIKQFLKHKQFYKHEEKTCIMVDNDINNVKDASSSSSTTTNTRRKMLIATRLKQHQQQLQQQQRDDKSLASLSLATSNSTTKDCSNQIQTIFDRDVFKCSLCYPDTDQVPSSSVSILHKEATMSTLGSSSFSYDKEQVLKHALIVHLSFLAYKCDGCSQFYLFDEPQTKQHAALIHQCGENSTINNNETTTETPTPTQTATSAAASNSGSCHFKLIKTEEEINLAINRAQQFIVKIGSNSKTKKFLSMNANGAKHKNNSPTGNSAVSSIDASPKYKCCKCNTTPSTTTTTTAVEGEKSETTTTPNQASVLYSYQDALDHVMQVHIMTGQGGLDNNNKNKKDKKFCYELELFEQNLEDLLASEFATPDTTTTAPSATTTEKTQTLSKNEIKTEKTIENNDPTDKDKTNPIEDDNEQQDDDTSTTDDLDELSKWNVIIDESFLSTSTPTDENNANSPSSLPSSGGRKKRMRVMTSQAYYACISGASNNNTTTTTDGIPLTPTIPINALINDTTTDTITTPAKKTKTNRNNFYFKPYLSYHCQICPSKMKSFDLNHWLLHDNENLESGEKKQITCFKCTSTMSTLSNIISSQSSNNKTVINFNNFREYLAHYKEVHCDGDNNKNGLEEAKLSNCPICGIEVKASVEDISNHFSTEHDGLKLENLNITTDDIEYIHTLQMNNMVQLSEGITLKKHCHIDVPPLLLNTNAVIEAIQQQAASADNENNITDKSNQQLSISLINNLPVITRRFLIEKELKLLNEIIREQIVDKQIASWLNSEQFMRRTFNYNSYVCIICNASKLSILQAHFKLDQNDEPTTTSTGVDVNELYSDEMKTVVLTNHILTHFNEYCYRCMSCKISWPDRTQLLKHAQECSNSQVVRTKTKYKLKANCRMQLKFYLQTYIEYWSNEILEESQIKTLKSNYDKEINNGDNNEDAAKKTTTEGVTTTTTNNNNNDNKAETNDISMIDVEDKNA
jgi:hypothetical protein